MSIHWSLLISTFLVITSAFQPGRSSGKSGMEKSCKDHIQELTPGLVVHEVSNVYTFYER